MTALDYVIKEWSATLMREEDKAVRKLILQLGRHFDWANHLVGVHVNYGDFFSPHAADQTLTIRVEAIAVGRQQSPAPNRMYRVNTEAVEQAFREAAGVPNVLE